MESLSKLLHSFSSVAIPILDEIIPMSSYTPLDLSSENPNLKGIDIIDPDICQAFIDGILNKNDAQVAFGGYLEKRSLYADRTNFSGKFNRNIHLGVDFWAKAGTKVLVPIDGTVHSFQNNATSGDYGPTIILKHQIEDNAFYTLYGHLSLESLKNLFVGKNFRKGEIMAGLGTSDINVNYAPHLHFQIIDDLQDKKGDYPGVCSEDDLSYYIQNCPDPNLLLKIMP